MRKRLKWIGYSVLVLCLLFVAFLAYGTTNNRFYKVVAVQSGSMAPTLNPGDMIVLSRSSFDEANVGDIVTISESGYLLTHRILEKDASSLLLKGDANKFPDLERVSPDSLGKYVFKIPLIGKLFGRGPNKTGAWLTERVKIGGNKVSVSVSTTSTSDLPPTTISLDPPTSLPDESLPIDQASTSTTTGTTLIDLDF